MTCRKKIICLVMAVVSVFALMGCGKPTFAEMEEKAEQAREQFRAETANSK